MKMRVLLRQIHHWGSIVIALPLLVMIGAGLLLMLKKDVDWIQPPTQSAQSATGNVPMVDLETLLTAAKSVPQAGISDWSDLDRVDIKPGKGIVKFISNSRWEVQIDLHTSRVLQVAYRRSDLIESLHDGSFFADWAKLYVFFPAGIVLFVLWATGLYLFALPHIQRARRRRDKRQRLG